MEHGRFMEHHHAMTANSRRRTRRQKPLRILAVARVNIVSLTTLRCCPSISLMNAAAATIGKRKHHPHTIHDVFSFCGRLKLFVDA
ncbi:hypothetical protein [Pectobacterium polaris]|uniref:hypothetical protein n=1 Tax=Pectobacterium polaris TaxID=2042057 RepID=UPI0021C8AAFD|nr:hypothetical protein [Pectobacterium polaris]